MTLDFTRYFDFIYVCNKKVSSWFSRCQSCFAIFTISAHNFLAVDISGLSYTSTQFQFYTNNCCVRAPISHSYTNICNCWNYKDEGRSLCTVLVLLIVNFHRSYHQKSLWELLNSNLPSLSGFATGMANFTLDVHLGMIVIYDNVETA